MTNKTYCPYAWNHLSSQATGVQRLCCNVKDASHIKDNDGKTIHISQVTNLVEYFNLDHYKQIRRNMINGVKNKECELCYEIEDNGGYSMRNYAVKQYPYENFKEITDLTTGEISEVNVNYLDLSWSNKCNLQCRMCSPWASDQLVKEYKEVNLDLPATVDFNFINKWKFEDILPVLENVMTGELDTILVTGGEPLINNEFYKFCIELNKRGLSKNINLSFHTNLTVLPQKWEEVFLPFKCVNFKVSIDGINEVYEYIRFPGKWNIVKENIKEVCDTILKGNTNFEIEFHVVFSMFNLHGIKELLDYLLSLPESKKIRRFPHVNYVFNPEYASPNNIPLEYREEIAETIHAFLNDNEHRLRGEKTSIIKANLAILKNQPISNTAEKNFELLKEIDKRRGHDTYKYLPWLKDFEEKQ